VRLRDHRSQSPAGTERPVVIAARVPIFNSSVRDRVARLFEGSHTPTASRVGVEIEVFGIRPSGAGPVPVGRADLEPLLAHAPGIAAAAATSFEPGGQLELSLRPARDALSLIERACATVQSVKGVAAGAGLATIACGTDPLPGRMDWDLQVDAPRYRVMQEHFDQLGGRGRRMMRQTAALQVCVEVPAGRHGVDAWVMLNRAGPAIAAAFCDSPVLEHTAADVVGNRLAVWLETDASRTGFDGSQVDAVDPVDAYTEFALDALAMPLDSRNGKTAPPLTPRTLRTLRDRLQHPDGPGVPDVDHHLSTLFPPVRPRGDYLEVRFVDALPWRMAEVAILLLTLLAQDSEACAAALECTQPRESTLELWQRSCRRGPRDAQLAAQACALLDIAATAASRRGQHSRPAERLLRDYRERYPQSRRCPGDDLAALLARSPEALGTWM
jgi:glutamate--cysteine ligase